MSGLLERIGDLSPRKRELLLHQLRALDRDPAEPEIRPRPAGEAPLPLSFAQLRQWFLDQLEPGSPAFHLFGGLRFEGPLTPALFAASLREVARRHEALRTRFDAPVGEPEQMVDPEVLPELPRVDLRGLEAEVRESEIDRLAVRLARSPFDLSRGPLLRACLLLLGPADHALLVTLHHIVADGWSMGLFFRDLLAFYRALAQGRPADLPPLAVQYPDFALWQRRRLQGEVLERELAYWRARLAGAPETLELPTDRPRPEAQSYRGATLRFALPEDLAVALKALARREGATLFMVLLAGFAALLHRHTGQDDLPVGSPIANRKRTEIEGLIGLFVNTLVLRIDAAGDPGLAELLQRVSRTTLEAYEHQDLPFERLVEELQPARSLGRQPLFQVLFQLQNAPVPEATVPGLTLRPLAAPDLGTASFDLTLSLTESEGRLHGSLQYSSDLFRRRRMESLAARFETLLAGAAAAPERPLSDLPVLTPAELFQVLREWPGRAGEEEPDLAGPAAWKGTEPVTPFLLPERGSAEAGARGATPVEEIVAGVWAEVLGREEVPLRESFFDLGGHSLLATRVVSRLRQALRVELPVRSLFEAPTVAALARRIEDATRSGPAMEAPPIVRVAREGRLPLSFAQQRLWFLDQLQPGFATYNIPTALRLRGPLDRGALARSFAEVQRRHEVLRTTFPMHGGEPAQEIDAAGSAAALVLPEVDLTAVPGGRAEAEALRLLAARSWQPFDLACGPLARLLLLRLGEREHLLLVVLHHAISDAWSTAVLLRELAALYGAALEGRPSPLPDLPVQYADFASWQRRWLAGEVLERQLAYWRPRLQGAPALELPTDRPRPAVQTYRGAALPVTVPADLWADVRALSRSQGITPFMALLAAFQILLHRWAAQEDVTVGFPIAGRNRAEIEELIGCFVNTLALRSRLHGAMTLRRLLAGVRLETFGAYAHQDLPFEKLVEELQPERQVSHNPVFQALLTLDNVPRQPFSLGRAGAEPVAIPGGAAKLDLTLALAETGEGLAGRLEYNADLFLVPTIARLAGQLEILLRELGSHLDRPLADLPLLGPAERHQLLFEWGEAAVELPEPCGICLHQEVELQATRAPGAVALVDRGSRVTYGELEERANRLAHHLVALGVGPEVRVGLCLERGAELVVGMLGILKAGGAYVPLDLAYPPDRLRYMAEDSGALLVLSDGRGLDRLRGLPVRVVSLEAERARIEARGGEPPRVDAGLENLSHVIYTSGSTGRPKGVAITHRGATALLRWARRVFTPAELEGVLAATSVSFDLSVFEIFVPLSTGGRVILAENALHLPELAAAGEVTLINTVPSAIAELLRGDGIPPGVRTVNLAGEALRADLAAAILARPGIGRLFNLYGPSEDTTYSTWARIEAGETDPVPIGRPLDGTRAYVLDAGLRPAPPGVPGELCLGGEGLARGYLGRPELTAERFIPDAWSQRPGERLYRTGDRVLYRPDGRLAFLGRQDHQVKLRGYRIELGEIEAALARHPGIAETVVVVRGSAGREEPRLIAYVVPAAPDRPPGAGELREHLRAWLPAYMVPEIFVALTALPRTGSGKVDRRALPEPDFAAAPAAAVHEEPLTATEQAVAQVWREVLGVERIGLHDNFFDLGGHSLLLARVYHQLKPLSGRPFPLVALFEHSTVHAVAAFLDQGGPGSASRQAGQERGARRREAAGRRLQTRGIEP